MRSTLRRRAPLLPTALAAAAIAFPLGAFAIHQFPDVPDSNLFHADIDALVDSGVTSGCGGGNYCPSANVTREQMAAFLNRLGALAPGKTPVVNADRLDGKDSSVFLQGTQFVTHLSGPWQLSPNSDPAAGIGNYADRTGIASTTGSMFPVLFIPTPNSTNGTQFAFVSARVCFRPEFQAGNMGLDSVTVTRRPDDGSAVTVASFAFALGSTTLASAGCHTVTDLTPETVTGPLALEVGITLDGAGQAFISTTTVTWLATSAQG